MSSGSYFHDARTPNDGADGLVMTSIGLTLAELDAYVRQALPILIADQRLGSALLARHRKRRHR